MTRLTPIFYTRGVNPPYTEGHIKVVTTIVKSLRLCDVQSVVFNFKYRSDAPQEKTNLFWVRHEKTVPLLSRREMLSNKVPIAIVTSLAESLIGLNFIVAERLMTENRRRTVINIVNSSRYLRAIAGRFLKSPLLFHFYMPRVINPFLTRVMMKRADAMISSSHNVASFLETIGVDRDKIFVIYPPVDTAIFKPIKKETAKLKTGFPQDSRVLLYLGTLRANRFPEHILFDAMENLVKEGFDPRLFVFAPANQENKMRAASISKKASVMGLSGNVSLFNKNLGDLEKNLIFNASDILLFPALKGEVIEPPLTVLEAMAAGLPVICSDSFSTRELFGDHMDGFLVPLENMNGFHWGEKISSLLRSGHSRMKFSDQARRIVLSKASVDVAGPRLVEAFESAYMHAKRMKSR